MSTGTTATLSINEFQRGIAVRGHSDTFGGLFFAQHTSHAGLCNIFPNGEPVELQVQATQ